MLLLFSKVGHPNGLYGHQWWAVDDEKKSSKKCQSAQASHLYTTLEVFPQPLCRPEWLSIVTTVFLLLRLSVLVRCLQL